MIERRVTEQLIGTQASVQMGELRSIQVFVVGDAQTARAPTRSMGCRRSPMHCSSAAVSTTIGSLRNIELKRNGQTVTRLDLYDLLLRR